LHSPVLGEAAPFVTTTEYVTLQVWQKTSHPNSLALSC
jgi:hypothetical protein